MALPHSHAVLPKLLLVVIAAGMIASPAKHTARAAAAVEPGLERTEPSPPSRHSLWDLINRQNRERDRPAPRTHSARRAAGDGSWSPMFLLGRSGQSAVYDPVRDRMLVFGGDEWWQFTSDVWELSFSGTPAWTNITPNGPSPSGRSVHVAVYDPVRDRMVVFGGWDGTPRQDVWTLALSGTPAWTELTPVGSPPSDGVFDVAVYDPVRDRLLVFDDTDSGWNDAVWALSLSGTPAWTQLSPAGTPPPARNGMSAVYDPVRDRVVIFGGDDGGYPNRNDTWELSLSGTPEWNELSPNGPMPSGRSGHVAIYDADGDRMVICGGTDQYEFTSDAWALSFSGTPAWTRITAAGNPPGRAIFSAVFDSQRDRMVIFAGVDDVYYPDLNDAWALSLSGSPAWTPVPGAFPGVRSGHTVIRDSARDRLIVCGGYTWPPRFYQDVWELPLSGSAPWKELVPSGAKPSGRYRHSSVYDPLRDRMVVFAGTGFSGARDDVWTLSFSGSPSWAELSPAGVTPPPRYGHTAIYDAHRDRMVIFGGEGYNDVWTLALGVVPHWTEISPAGTPPSERRGHSAIYDPLRDRMVTFGGGGTNDVWVLSLSGNMEWTELSPMGTPPTGRSDQSAIYDTVRDRMVIFGGHKTGSYDESNETWSLSFNGTPAWLELTPAELAPAPRRMHAAVYDPRRDRMAVFGGGDFWVDFNDAWALVWGEPTGTNSTPSFANALGPCFPNPFNPRVTIPFELQNDGPATLAVYDVSGHRVRTLLSEWTARGVHNVTWDGNSDTGVHVSSGVYFCHLYAGGFSATRKVVLLK